MAIIGIGTDLVDIKRIEKLLEAKKQSFFNRIFSASEQEHCNAKASPAASYAKRFAAKEAFAKALGTGIGEHANWVDIEVANQENGKPFFRLSGRAAASIEAYEDKGMDVQVDLSLSDEYPYAQAFVVISAF